MMAHPMNMKLTSRLRWQFRSTECLPPCGSRADLGTPETKHQTGLPRVPCVSLGCVKLGIQYHCAIRWSELDDPDDWLVHVVSSKRLSVLNYEYVDISLL